MGITLVDFPNSDYDKTNTIRDNVVKKLNGTFFSKAIVDKVETLRKKL